MLARYVLWLYVCLSVRPSQVGVLRTQLILGSRKQHGTIARDSSFLTQDHTEIPNSMASPQRGHQIHLREKICDVRQTTRRISKTIGLYKIAQPPILARVRCGQTVGWIKMPLGTEIDLSPCDIVRWGPRGNCAPLGVSCFPI